MIHNLVTIAIHYIDCSIPLPVTYIPLIQRRANNNSVCMLVFCQGSDDWYSSTPAFHVMLNADVVSLVLDAVSAQSSYMRGTVENLDTYVNPETP